jgi:hypothetical protein
VNRVKRCVSLNVFDELFKNIQVSNNFLKQTVKFKLYQAPASRLMWVRFCTKRGLVSLLINSFINVKSDAANAWCSYTLIPDRTIRNRIQFWPQQKDPQTRDPMYMFGVNVCCGPHNNILLIFTSKVPDVNDTTVKNMRTYPSSAESHPH